MAVHRNVVGSWDRQTTSNQSDQSSHPLPLRCFVNMLSRNHAVGREVTAQQILSQAEE
jgi:hypothetical protein